MPIACIMQEDQSLAAALNQWLQLAAIGRKPRTVDYHQEIVALIRTQWPGDLNASVSSITEAHVLEFIPMIERYCVSRFNAIVTVLKATVPAAYRIKRKKIVLKDRALISRAQFAALLAELQRRPRSHAGLVVEFLAHTGLRINEARQLKWSDVQEDFILAPGAITKNGRPRMIPFVNGIREVLDGLRSVAGDSALILPQAEAKGSLRTACRRAGVPRLSHHDFRHLFATRCVQSGVDMPTLARWLGHRDGGALLGKIYFHLGMNTAGRWRRGSGSELCSCALPGVRTRWRVERIRIADGLGHVERCRRDARQEQSADANDRPEQTIRPRLAPGACHCDPQNVNGRQDPKENFHSTSCA